MSEGMNEIYDKHYKDIYVTNDYGKFKLMEGNRNIDTKHLFKMVESFKKKQLPIPIIVNKDFEILEGQHRYYACKSNNFPIYYTMIEDCGIEDAIIINTTSKKWGMEDYLNHYIALNKESYVNLKRFMDITNLNCNTSRIFCDLYSARVAKHNSKFAEGTFEMRPIGEALEKFELYKDYYKCPAFNMQSFILAVIKIIEHPKYNHKRMMSKIDDFYYRVTKRVTKNEYIQILTEVYNYNTTKDNKVYFYIDTE